MAPSITEISTGPQFKSPLAALSTVSTNAAKLKLTVGPSFVETRGEVVGADRTVSRHSLFQMIV